MNLNIKTDDYEITNGILTWVRKDIEKLELPESIEVIKREAFEGCTNLKKVFLPSTLKRIGNYTFGKCQSLEEITIPEGVEVIEGYEFEGCTNLKKVSLPNSLKQIGAHSFEDCQLLEEITIPEGVEVIEREAFEGCTNLKKVSLPSTLNQISQWTFRNCQSLEEITIPEGVEVIDERAFCNCINLKKVSLPSTLKQIRHEAFFKCQSLEEITIPEGVEVIDERAFCNCINLKKVSLPSTLKQIRHEAFFYCINLKKVSLPRTLKKISFGTFQNCQSLEEITLPEDVEIINHSTFAGCINLKKVVLPKKLKKIAESSFYDCQSLEEMIIPDSVETIRYTAFAGCRSLKKISLPGMLEAIDASTFSNCPTPEEIVIPDSIPSDMIEYILNMFNSSVDFKRIIIKTKQSNPIKKINKKQKLKKLIKAVTDAEIIFVKEDDAPKTINSSKIEDDEIQQLLDKISEICNNLPEKNQEAINNQVKNILTVYNERKEELKPQYNQSNTLTQGGTISMVRDNTITRLEGILLSLSREKKLIEFLKNIEKYKQLLDTNVTELSNDDSIESNIKNIIYYSNLLNPDKKSKIIDKLKSNIETISEECSKQLQNMNNQIVLTLNNNEDYEKKLSLDISEMLDNIKNDYNTKKPYIELLDCLKSNKFDINNSDETIIGDISKIRYVLSKLSSSNYKSEFENKFNSIFEKCINQITKILNDDKLLNKSNYEDLELELRKDINPLLELINNYAYLDKYEEHTANKTNIHNQLQKSLDLINQRKQVKLTKELSSEIITSFAIETYNEVLSSTELTTSDKEIIINDLKNSINEALNELKKKTVDSLKEYNEVVYDILGKIAKVKYNASLYIKENIEYKNNTK